MKKILTGIAAVMAVLATAPAIAEGDWLLNPAIGYQGFGSERDLDNSATGIIGVEKQLSSDWGVEARYMFTAADHKYIRNADAELSQLHIDALRYFGKFGGDRFTPYAALGLGLGDFNYDGGQGNNNETQANAGGGVRFAIDQQWSARFDARVINSLDNEQTDGLVSLGVSYAFGGTPTAAPAPMKPAETDTDGDGVGDSKDRCAGTPVGVVVNASGCPLDTDGDGVPDYMDKCPKSPAGRQVGKQGCKFVLSLTKQIRMEVNFGNNSADIPAAYLPEIEKVAKYLKQYGGAFAVVEGHSDAAGSDAYNKMLSQRRADSVKSELVTRFGIDASRLTAVGYGEERPIASNDTREGRRANRRVVAVLKAEVSE
jgi:OOP family OmpA-OmpF porin